MNDQDLNPEELFDLERGIHGFIEDIVVGDGADPESKMVATSVRVYPGTMAQLDSLSKSMGVTRAYLIRRLLELSVFEARREFDSYGVTHQDNQEEGA